MLDWSVGDGRGLSAYFYSGLLKFRGDFVDFKGWFCKLNCKSVWIKPTRNLNSGIYVTWHSHKPHLTPSAFHNCFIVCPLPVAPVYLMYSFSCAFFFLFFFSSSKFNYQFTFHSNNNHLKNHVCCLQSPSRVGGPSALPLRVKRKAAIKSDRRQWVK